jgi:hypothetical protein
MALSVADAVRALSKWKPSPTAPARTLAAVVAFSGGLLLTAGPWLANLGHPDGCAYRIETGRPCVGCDGTKAFRRAVVGDLRGAARLNLLGGFAGVVSWLMCLGGLAGALSGRLKALAVVGLVVVLATPVVVVARWMQWTGMLP